jgi:hypothetical protein
MRILVCFLALATVTGCASGGTDWPSLSRPAERQAAAQTPAAAPPADSPAADSQEAAGIAARLAQDQRALDVAQQRWTTQRSAFEATAAAARGAATGSEAWSIAQRDLTRLNQVGASYGEILDSVEIATADLAVLAANGQPVQAALAQAGSLIKALRAARDANAVYAADAAKRLSR